MATRYSLDKKVTRYLKEKHGITAEVDGGKVTVGDFSEKIVVISEGNLDKLAERIKAVLAKSGAI